MHQTFKASDHNKHAVTNHHHHHQKKRRTPIYQSAKPHRGPLVKQWTGINVQSSFHDLACNQISQSRTVLILLVNAQGFQNKPETRVLLDCISLAVLVITISLWQTISIVTATCFSRVGAYFKTFWNPWIHCTFFIIFGLIRTFWVSDPHVHDFTNIIIVFTVC